MIWSSTCSSAWLLLLLPLLVRLHLTPTSLSGLCKEDKTAMHQLERELKKLGEHVKICPDICSLVDSTNAKCQCLNISLPHGNAKCQCLNISLPHGDATFPQYFSHGLDILYKQFSSKNRILKDILIHFNKSECWRPCFTQQRENYELIISPASFHKNLERAKQMCREKLSSPDCFELNNCSVRS